MRSKISDNFLLQGTFITDTLRRCSLLNASPYATCIARENLKASRQSFYLSQYFFYQPRPFRYILREGNVCIDAPWRCSLDFRTFHLVRRPIDPPRQPRRAGLADGPGITKIRGSMIYNGVMGAWDDMALLLLPAGIIAEGWPRHCPGGEPAREIDSSKIERECSLFLLISLFPFARTLNKYYPEITCLRARENIFV